MNADDPDMTAEQAARHWTAMEEYVRVGPQGVAEMHARIAALEAENARLREWGQKAVSLFEAVELMAAAFDQPTMQRQAKALIDEAKQWNC